MPPTRASSGWSSEGHRPTVDRARRPAGRAARAAHGGRVVLGPAMRADLVIDMSGEPGERFTVIDSSIRGLAYRLLDLAYATSRRSASIRSTRRSRLAGQHHAGAGSRRAPSATRCTFGGGMMGGMMSATMDGRRMDDARDDARTAWPGRSTASPRRARHGAVAHAAARPLATCWRCTTTPPGTIRCICTATPSG